MKLLDMYSYIIANWLNAGEFNQRGKMQASDIIPQYNLIFTKSHIKKVYRLTGIKPENINLAFIDFVREKMFELNPDVEVAISISNYPVRVDVNSEKFQRQMARASESYSSYREVFESQTGLARMTGKTYRLPGGVRIRLSKERLDNLKQVFLSYYYLYNHISGGGTVSLTEVFLEIIGKDLRTVKRAGDDLYGVFGPLNIGVEELRGILKTYLNEFGPAMAPPQKLNKKFLPQLLFSDENNTAFSTYKGRGLVGGKGLLLGVDVRSRLPLSINIFSAPAAQVFLLCGRTGSGKTYAAFQIAMSALAHGVHVSAIDIKGREWSKLSCVCTPKIITFDEKNPSFVNTLRLDDLRVDELNSNEMFNVAVQGTVNLLTLITNLQPGEGNKSDLELVLREAVLKLYSMRGVDPVNPSTFKKTAGMKYADLIPALSDLTTTKTYTEEQRKMLALAIARCGSYIRDGGIFADAFKNEVSLSDVLENPLVIYELNKNQNAMSDSLDVLRVFMIQFLDSKKMSVLKERNKFLLCAYEELQRCGQFGDLLTYIAHSVTGARSNNAIILLLMNSLRVLEQKDAQDIRSNITSVVCGFVEDNDIEILRNNFDRPWLAHQLELFRDKPNLYRNNFAMDCDTGDEILRTVYKVIVPDYLAEAFRTRSIIED